jgi:hypothetical protein
VAASDAAARDEKVVWHLLRVYRYTRHEAQKMAAGLPFLFSNIN